MRHHWIAAFSASLIATGAVAQEARPAAPLAQKSAKAMTSGRHVTLDKIVGATVRMQASAEDSREAAKEGEQADRPKGEIGNLIIDASDGSIDWAIVSVGGLLGIGEHDVAVPLSKLQCTTDKDGGLEFTIAMTKAELKAEPKFDASEAKKTGLRDAVRALGVREVGRGSDGEVRVREAAADKAKGKLDDTAMEALNGPRLILASDLKGCQVHAKSEKFGSVDQVLVDNDSHCVDYLVVSHCGVVGIGDSTYLVPMAACKLIEHDDKAVLQISKNSEEFSGAPKYAKPEKGHDPLSADLAKRSCDFFAVGKSKTDKTK